MKYKFGLIAKDIKNSVTPSVYRHYGKDLGDEIEFEIKNVPEDQLEATLAYGRENWDGFNVTMPYKQAALKYMDEVDESAVKCGSTNTVMVKGGNYMETLAKVDTVLMDKTGTLTRGSFDVQRIEPKGMTEDELVDLVAHAEMVSPHPMAKAVLTYYGKRPDASRIGAAEEIAGCGARALVDGHVICAGRRTWIAEITGEEIAPADYAAIYVAVDGKYAGFIEVADAVKPDAKQAVADLKKAGVKRVVMLTGDNESIARRVAAELGIDEVHAELLPDGKVDCAEKIMQEGGTTAFVGDGINDAPLLARADVGIAMGALGSDAAIEAADVVIMNDEPSRIALAMAIARKTMAIVRGNVVLSLAVKFAVLVLAALGVVGMWTAVFADVGVAMLAILNSMRTLRFAKKVR